MDLQPAVVVNKSQFPESVHEEADPRASRTDHFRQHFLTDLGNYGLGFAFLAKMSEQQENPSQPFFTRIEKLINQVFFVTDVPRQQIGDEHVGNGVFPMKRLHHGLLVDSQNSAIRQRGCRAHAECLACKGPLTEKVSFT